MRDIFFRMANEKLKRKYVPGIRNNKRRIYSETINEGVANTSFGEYSVSVTRSAEEIYAGIERLSKLKEALKICLKEKVYRSDEPDERMLGILEQRVIYEKSLKDVGKKYGISAPRVKELENKAFQTLWLPRNQLRLKEFQSI